MTTRGVPVFANGMGRGLIPADHELAFARARSVALKEAEHRPMIEHRFASVAHRIEYWDVDDIEFLDPPTALGKIDEQVRLLIGRLQI